MDGLMVQITLGDPDCRHERMLELCRRLASGSSPASSSHHGWRIVELGPDQRLVALEQNTARARADDRSLIGDEIRFGWHPEHALVLR